MRTVALIILFLASLSGITAHAQLKLIPKERLDSVANPPLAPNAATLKFECLRIDAGEMNETDGPVVFTYGFVNLGNVPVSISRWCLPVPVLSLQHLKRRSDLARKGQ